MKTEPPFLLRRGQRFFQTGRTFKKFEPKRKFIRLKIETNPGGPASYACMKRILILEDNKDRRASFERAVRELGGGFEVKFWDDPALMARECE